MGFDLICTGMALVDSIIKGFNPEPVSASGYIASSASLSVGGEAVNEAMAAAKLGLRTAIICALGPDAAGGMIRAALEACNVYTGLIVTSPRTPVTTMFVHDDGTRKSITNDAHRYNFHPERIQGLSGETKALILGSLFRAPFDDPDIVYSVLSSAKARIVFADTKLPNFRKLTMEDLKDSWPLIDYVTPNEDEARFFTGETDPEKMADAFLKYGAKNVIIKLGRDGCLLKNEKEAIRLQGYSVQAVDATGAGDQFLAGFASEIIRGMSHQEALRFANACGAICTTAIGAATALKNREQVLRFIKDVQTPKTTDSSWERMATFGERAADPLRTEVSE